MDLMNSAQWVRRFTQLDGWLRVSVCSPRHLLLKRNAPAGRRRDIRYVWFWNQNWIVGCVCKVWKLIREFTSQIFSHWRVTCVFPHKGFSCKYGDNSHIHTHASLKVEIIGKRWRAGRFSWCSVLSPTSSFQESLGVLAKLRGILEWRVMFPSFTE